MQLLGPDFRNGMVKRVKLRQRGDSSNRRRDMAIFRLFKMAASWIFKFLTVGRLKMAELRRHANFGPNPSKSSQDMAIF